MGHDRARSAYRKGVAVELHTQGYSYDEIAETLGFKDRSGAGRGQPVRPLLTGASGSVPGVGRPEKASGCH